jgi:long-subunit acyl-CoA synthetase (AMP-forming)
MLNSCSLRHLIQIIVVIHFESMSYTCIQVVALYAANSIGAQLVPMYEAQLLKDWQYIVEDSGARLVLVGPETIYEKVKGFVGSVR